MKKKIQPGWQYYWHDLSNDRQIFSKKQASGGSVIVCAGFGSSGKTDIALVTNRLNVAGYQQLLEQYFLPQSEHIGGPIFIFQQHNAPIHIAKSTFEWFLDKGVHIIDWPPYSPRNQSGGKHVGYTRKSSVCRRNAVQLHYRLEKSYYLRMAKNRN